jgi:hypothetical protein
MLARPARRAGVAVAALATAMSLGACGADIVPGFGSDDSNTAEGKKAKAVVLRFAESSGPEACDMFTPAGLRKVYGAKEKPSPPPEVNDPVPQISLAECRRRAPKFSGQKVSIEKVDRAESGKMRVEATTDGGGRTFAVKLEQRADGAWLIDDIRER